MKSSQKDSQESPLKQGRSRRESSSKSDASAADTTTVPPPTIQPSPRNSHSPQPKERVEFFAQDKGNFELLRPPSLKALDKPQDAEQPAGGVSDHCPRRGSHTPRRTKNIYLEKQKDHSAPNRDSSISVGEIPKKEESGGKKVLELINLFGGKKRQQEAARAVIPNEEKKPTVLTLKQAMARHGFLVFVSNNPAYFASFLGIEDCIHFCLVNSHLASVLNPARVPLVRAAACHHGLGLLGVPPERRFGLWVWALGVRRCQEALLADPAMQARLPRPDHMVADVDLGPLRAPPGPAAAAGAAAGGAGGAVGGGALAPAAARAGSCVNLHYPAPEYAAATQLAGTGPQGEILRDLGRTYPAHPLFRDPRGAGQQMLANVLNACLHYHRDVGYCQGMNFVAGALLLAHLEGTAAAGRSRRWTRFGRGGGGGREEGEEEERRERSTGSWLSWATEASQRFSAAPAAAELPGPDMASWVTDQRYVDAMEDCFWALSALLAHKLEMRQLWTRGVPRMKLRVFQFVALVREEMPQVLAHLDRISLHPDILVTQWFLTLFAYALPVEEVVALWGALFAGGWKAVYRAALARLRQLEPELLGLDLEDMSVFLRRLRQEHLDSARPTPEPQSKASPTPPNGDGISPAPNGGSELTNGNLDEEKEMTRPTAEGLLRGGLEFVNITNARLHNLEQELEIQLLRERLDVCRGGAAGRAEWLERYGDEGNDIDPTLLEKLKMQIGQIKSTTEVNGPVLQKQIVEATAQMNQTRPRLAALDKRLAPLHADLEDLLDNKRSLQAQIHGLVEAHRGRHAPPRPPASPPGQPRRKRRGELPPQKSSSWVAAAGAGGAGAGAGAGRGNTPFPPLPPPSAASSAGVVGEERRGGVRARELRDLSWLSSVASSDGGHRRPAMRFSESFADTMRKVSESDFPPDDSVLAPVNSTVEDPSSARRTHRKGSDSTNGSFFDAAGSFISGIFNNNAHRKGSFMSTNTESSLGLGSTKGKGKSSSSTGGTRRGHKPSLLKATRIRLGGPAAAAAAGGLGRPRASFAYDSDEEEDAPYLAAPQAAPRPLGGVEIHNLAEIIMTDKAIVEQYEAQVEARRLLSEQHRTSSSLASQSMGGKISLYPPQKSPAGPTHRRNTTGGFAAGGGARRTGPLGQKGVSPTAAQGAGRQWSAPAPSALGETRARGGASASASPPRPPRRMAPASPGPPGLRGAVTLAGPGGPPPPRRGGGPRAGAGAGAGGEEEGEEEGPLRSVVARFNRLLADELAARDLERLRGDVAALRARLREADAAFERRRADYESLVREREQVVKERDEAAAEKRRLSKKLLSLVRDEDEQVDRKLRGFLEKIGATPKERLESDKSVFSEEEIQVGMVRESEKVEQVQEEESTSVLDALN